ncbi:hypothetical protein HCX49_04600 [Sphingobacterium kitahiroshimense]|uniref:hypothetical protein n=1 Tax=Sphingobacterium sp. B16(2022) TaxID=2914044 RepID=UPI001439DE52|nr:hypothetical protein [Sphingobacterium sp. B16(2022)]NJI72477.1 hypothetical protein [Sphingobacterium sp. B16(2022)]
MTFDLSACRIFIEVISGIVVLIDIFLYKFWKVSLFGAIAIQVDVYIFTYKFPVFTEFFLSLV